MSGIVEQWETTQRRITEACGRVGRDPAEVSVCAVSKTFGPESVREAAECGITVFGENRVQEAAQKIPLCPGHVEWHMVGHLQRNKVDAAVRLFGMLHAVDSLRLLESVDQACERAGVRRPACIEVNVSGESSKFGLAPEAVPELLDAGSRFMNVDLVGVMTLPPFTEDPEEARPFFRRLRELRDTWRAAGGPDLAELSMGMSHDFEVAIEEGATWVRLGSGLFGRRRTAAWKPGEPLD